MPYTLPAWQDAPSTATPISAVNLTQANTAINSIDSRLTTVETGKISTGLVNAQGNLISGDNTGTPRALLVGTDGQVLTADHTTATGLKWAAPAGASTPDATTTTKGVVQLAGDLAGTAAAPAINATGTPSSTTFLRGDKTWATPAGGGGTSVITTQGDLIAGNASGVAARLSPSALGAFDGDQLVYDSAQPLGYRYKSPMIVQGQGSPFALRAAVNFMGNVSVADDSGFNRTNMTVPNSTIPSVRATNPGMSQLFGNISSDNPMDGVTLVAGDRFWYQNNAAAGDSKVLIVNSDGSYSPAPEMPLNSVWNAGLRIYIREGVSKGGHTYIVSPTGGVLTWINAGYGNTGSAQLNVIDVSPQSVIGYTTIPLNGSNIFQIRNGGSFHCDIPNTAGNKVIAVSDPVDLTQPQVINLCIQQNSTGGTFWEISPSTIAWDNGITFTNGPGNPSPFDYTANTITFVRLTWMGSNIGYFGEIVASISPYFTPLASLPATWTMTNGITPWGGLDGQALNTDIYFMRYVTTTVQQYVYNALCHGFSAALRQRLRNNNYTVEIGARFNADGLRGSSQRGNVEQFGGYSASVAAGPYISGGKISDQAGAIGLITHEMCHGMSANYYGGNNPAAPNSQPNLMSAHATLVTLQQDCINNGNGSSGQNDEWFAEMERGRRVADNGSISPVSGSPLNAVGSGTNAGPGGTGGTPQQRADRFVTYMNSLGLV